ncbi:unnamed protein product [Owenia fusiformis]|uniref:Apple domain-containing protein n=1 Tax=Owenia fusiformis TaxID=6347 RepID=A0A8J1Y0E6_OWEFU|nr:unnamed protein product [Owenia fusiformis]
MFHQEVKNSPTNKARRCACKSTMIPSCKGFEENMLKVFILVLIIICIGFTTAGPRRKGIRRTTTKAPIRAIIQPSIPKLPLQCKVWLPAHTAAKYYAGYAWRVSYGVCLQGHNDVIKKFTIPISEKFDGPEMCLQMCWKSLNPICWSVDYRVDANPNNNALLDVTCILSKTSRVHNPSGSTVDLDCCYGWTYFERTPGWIWRNKPNFEIKNAMLNKKSLYAASLETCKKACAAEKDFICMSVEWKYVPPPAKPKPGRKPWEWVQGPIQKNCHLQARWKRYPAQTLSIKVGTIYAEKVVASSTGWAWTSIQNACISGHDTKVTPGTDIDECRKMCSEELNFVCLSVEFGGGTCRLSLADSSDQFHYNQPCAIPGTVYSEKNI